MAKHYILTKMPTERENCRLAYGIVGRVGDAIALIDKFTELVGENTLYSLHVKTVDGDTIDDLIAADPYFSHFTFCDTLDEFVTKGDWDYDHTD